MSKEGMSTSRAKRDGGTFNSSIAIYVNYEDVITSINSIRYISAANAAKAKESRNPTIDFYDGIAESSIQISKSWRSVIEKDVNQLLVSNARAMKNEMKSFSRYKTGRMRGAIRSFTGKNQYIQYSQTGWTDIWYKYFGFQEEGTITGISPMRALNRTYALGSYRMNSGINKITRSLRSVRNK
jgi:hypothetical protein